MTTELLIHVSKVDYRDLDQLFCDCGADLPLTLTSRTRDVAFKLEVDGAGDDYHVYEEANPAIAWVDLCDTVKQQDGNVKAWLSCDNMHVPCRVVSPDAPPPYKGWLAQKMFWWHDKGVEEKHAKKIKKSASKKNDKNDGNDKGKKPRKYRKTSSKAKVYQDANHSFKIKDLVCFIGFGFGRR